MTEQFGYVPSSFEESWRHCWDGESPEERTEVLKNFSAAIDYCFNPRDDDVSQNWILERAVLDAAAFIVSLPCTCLPGDDYGPCARCSALGRWHNERVER